MTTRRDVITGLAALPVLPAISGKAEAQPVPARISAVEEPPPAFLHEIDGQVFQELETMEAAIRRAKTELLAANCSDPVYRSGLLFLMRCNTNVLFTTADLARRVIDDQRVTANLAAKRMGEAVT